MSAKRVTCVETGRTWGSLKAAGEELGISPAAISYHLIGRAKHAGGYHFAYADEKSRADADDGAGGEKAVASFEHAGLSLIIDETRAASDLEPFLSVVVRRLLMGSFLLVVASARREIAAPGGLEGASRDMPGAIRAVVAQARLAFSERGDARSAIEALRELVPQPESEMASEAERMLAGAFRAAGTAENALVALDHAELMTHSEGFIAAWRGLGEKYEAYNALRRELNLS